MSRELPVGRAGDRTHSSATAERAAIVFFLNPKGFLRIS